MMQDREGITRWRQIGETLIKEIESGALPADQRLPASQDLAARFGVNRHTVLRALSHLQTEGFVRMERARGTYAVVNPLKFRIGARGWFEQNLLENNRSPSRTVLGIREIPASARIAQALEIPPDSSVVHVTLLGEADGVPINFNHHYFPKARLPAIAERFRAFGTEPTDKLSFSGIFRSFGIDDWHRRNIRIRSRSPSLEEASHLKMKPNDHVLETEVTSVDSSNTPIVHANTCYCASRMELVLDFSSERP